MQAKAKIFTNGRSQAVRLPAAFRFDAEEVYIWRNERTGDVVLSARPQSWGDFLTRPPAPEAADFLVDRVDPPPAAREI